MISDADIQYMRTALALARRGLGRVAPNPSVGCVIVKKDTVVGRGRTADGGRPHAETNALNQAGAMAKGGVAYMTLEPCAHQGITPPCAEALVKAGIARAVIGCIDPNPQVSGRGIEILKQAGIDVTVGVLEEECAALNQGFFLRMKENRPMVTLKIAMTGDGMILPKSGKREWITGSLARQHVHLERSQHDAILVGIGTVLNDDPMLTTRLGDLKHNAPRIILDSYLKTPLDCQIIRAANDVPVWIFYQTDAENKAGALARAGARLFFSAEVSPQNKNEIPVSVILKNLSDEGITRLLVEGGGQVLRAFVEAGICDRFLVYRAPNIQWPGGLFLDFEEIRDKMRLSLTGEKRFGEDLLEIYTRNA